MANLGYIQITRLCNQNCRFCSNPPENISLPFSEGRKIIDDFISKRYDGVILSGGEPTLSDELPAYLRYCLEKKFYAKMITNGQRLSSYPYLQTLKEAGLYHCAVSLYSCQEEIQAFLAEKNDSLENIIRALENLHSIGGIVVDVNIVINKYNANHLNKISEFVVKNFPFVRHFVFNNVDPFMNNASLNADTIPKLNEFELELYRAMTFLSAQERTFRVERVPLCYMTEFSHCSTETRRIVKKESKAVYFLDERGLFEQFGQNGSQNGLYYGKASCCKNCSVNDICAGLYQMDTYFSSDELYPVFVSKEAVVQRILS